jgi:hypothetical protein
MKTQILPRLFLPSDQVDEEGEEDEERKAKQADYKNRCKEYMKKYRSGKQ